MNIDQQMALSQEGGYDMNITDMLEALRLGKLDAFSIPQTEVSTVLPRFEAELKDGEDLERSQIKLEQGVQMIYYKLVKDDV